LSDIEVATFYQIISDNIHNVYIFMIADELILRKKYVLVLPPITELLW
jgi:hypothetical protein